MNENRPVDRTRDGSGASVAMGLFLGALVGAGLALLFAPGTGKETRRRLAEAGRRWGGAARNTLDQARDVAGDLQQDAMAALKTGRETFDHGPKS